MANIEALRIGEHGEIRITPDGKMSVFDIISACAEYSTRTSRYHAWRDIQSEYPEVCSKIRHFKFPGRGQKETPVLDKEGILMLLGVLPGKAGKAYREFAARLILDYLENPTKLAVAATRKVEDEGELLEIATVAYRKYIEKYHPLMGEIKERDGMSPATYVRANTINTATVMGKKPKLIKAERGGKTARTHATPMELTRLAVLQDLQVGGVRKRNARGHTQITQVILDAANRFKELLDEFGAS